MHFDQWNHGLRTPREERAFTARPKIHSHSQIFSYGRSIFCLPHRPNFSDFFDLCLHWVSVVRVYSELGSHVLNVKYFRHSLAFFTIDSFSFFKRWLIGLKFRIFWLSDRVNKIDKCFKNIDTKMYVNIPCLSVKYIQAFFSIFQDVRQN